MLIWLQISIPEVEEIEVAEELRASSFDRFFGLPENIAPYPAYSRSSTKNIFLQVLMSRLLKNKVGWASRIS